MLIKSNKVIDIVTFMKNELSGIYDDNEIISMISLLFDEYTGLSRADIVMNANTCINESVIIKLIEATELLKKEKPLQYITGKAHFLGHVLEVNSHTLIPRPETEELANWIINDCLVSKFINPRILDIGTGSGCIAIALKSALPDADVNAVDISKEALRTAMRNALNCGTAINFHEADITEDVIAGISGQFDIIVSNPPYVTEKEKLLMRKNVLEHEPHIALFVPDDEPLIFYRHIGNYAVSGLKPEGRLFLEINTDYPVEISTLYRSLGFSKVLIKKDLQGKDRMARIS